MGGGGGGGPRRFARTGRARERRARERLCASPYRGGGETRRRAADGQARRVPVAAREGELATFTYQAHSAMTWCGTAPEGAPGMMGEVRLRGAGNYDGGEADAYAELDVTLFPVQRQADHGDRRVPGRGRGERESAKRAKAALELVGGEQEPRRGDRRQGMSARAQGRCGAGVAGSHGGAQAGGRGLASRRGAPRRRAGPARSRARGRRAPRRPAGPDRIEQARTRG